MKVFKDKEGKKLTASEFFSRWGEGIKQITPQQKMKYQLRGTFTILIGLICGLVISIMAYDRLWWVAIILIGALMVNGTSFLSLLQQKRMLDSISKSMEKLK
jgi:hypothetical protein